MDDPNTPERHINIHFSPDIMAGVYSNFANVSHSDYEFTITFARVDHEVEDEEIPGVVVSRINLSARFMQRADRCDAGQLLQMGDTGGHQEPARGQRRRRRVGVRSRRRGLIAVRPRQRSPSSHDGHPFRDPA